MHDVTRSIMSCDVISYCAWRSNVGKIKP